MSASVAIAEILISSGATVVQILTNKPRAKGNVSIMLITKPIFSAYLFAIAMCINTTSYACEMFRWPNGWHLDQDLFVPPKNEDRNYTMGVLLDWSGVKATNHCLNASPVLEWIHNAIGMKPINPTWRSVSIGSSAFTPDRIESTAVIPEDRPYSSILYTSTTITSEDDPGKVATSEKLVIGILGLRLAESVQTWIHQRDRARSKKDKPYDPQGWSHQVSDGGEPTFMYELNRFWRGDIASKYMDSALSGDVSVGYYTNASFGGALKLGSFNKNTTPFWNMITNQNAQSNANGLLKGDREIYLLLGYRVRAVAYNALMQCQFGRSDLCFGSNDIERIVYESSWGINYTTKNKNRFMFTCNHRTAEHKRAEKRGHYWCGLNYYSYSM